MKKKKHMTKIPIQSVLFTYNGDDEAFQRFLHAVVHDYVNSDKSPVIGFKQVLKNTHCSGRVFHATSPNRQSGVD